MTCREFVEFFNEWLSGELPESVSSDFEDHLAHCVDCVAYLETYRLTKNLRRLTNQFSGTGRHRL